MLTFPSVVRGIRLKDVLARWGVHVFRVLPRGVDPVYDVSRLLSRLPHEVVFDVGAHRGEVALRFLKSWPKATVHGFEPDPQTFADLRRRVGAHPRTRLHQCALGASVGEGRLSTSGASDLHRLLPPDTADPHHVVKVSSLDELCRSEGIRRIDYLKIDTEGHDLDVLRGAEKMLRDRCIGVIEVEAGMLPEKEVHVPLEELRTHLLEAGYRLFGLYEQMNQWTTGSSELRRVNAVFISDALTNPTT